VKDLRKKRDEERQKQLRWREEHRNALLHGHDSSDTGADSLPGAHRRDPPPPPPPPPAPASAAPGPGTTFDSGPTFDSVGRTRALYGIEPGREQAFRQKQWRHVRTDSM